MQLQCFGMAAVADRKLHKPFKRSQTVTCSQRSSTCAWPTAEGSPDIKDQLHFCHTLRCMAAVTYLPACIGDGGGRPHSQWARAAMQPCSPTRRCCSTPSSACWPWCRRPSTSCRTGQGVLCPPKPHQPHILGPPMHWGLSSSTNLSQHWPPLMQVRDHVGDRVQGHDL